ncbi:hypothetical protein Ccrd_006744 [Cynara cardunculus var. scolymus]|uniref:Uncharacterized protein n=1 Tax=Cynara cardunculus var. scolymus TaxID=59895 RepID=A0A124SBP1_CYNCS|nr:hypothetical protein Ccrd_006744 [Cynara cardunculus var. scolymus]
MVGCMPPTRNILWPHRSHQFHLLRPNPQTKRSVPITLV